MSTKLNSENFIAQRRLYTFLPLLVFPFVTLLYWAVGMDLIFPKQDPAEKAQGLNKELPAPSLHKESGFGKLAYYGRALRDSARKKDLLKSDPYRSSEAHSENKAPRPGAILGLGAPAGFEAPAGKSSAIQPQASVSQARITRQLHSLDSVLSAPVQPGIPAAEPAQQANSGPQASVNPAELERIQQLMAGMQQQQTEPDAEIQELNGLLEKVLDIQHPERVTERLRHEQVSKKSDALPVNTGLPNQEEGAWQTRDTDSQIRFQPNGFFSLDEEVSAASDNAVTAVIAQDQTLVSGAVIKLRLTVDIYISGKLIPKGSFLYGLTSLSGERLLVKLESIRIENSLFPVNLSVYDLDGLEGIYVPGAISRDVAKQSLSQQIQTLSIGSLDPSLGAQAATAGVQAAKSLLNGKNRLIQLTVTAGYQLLLKDGSQHTF